MFDFSLHLKFALQFRHIEVLKKNLARIEIVFHGQQEKIPSALLDGRSTELFHQSS